MSTIQDRMICGICKGYKIVVIKESGRPNICPKCKGRGYFPTTEELKEEQSGRDKVLLHG